MTNKGKINMRNACCAKKIYVKKIQKICVLFFILYMTFVLGACTKNAEIPTLPSPAIIAVAPFNQPIYNAQLLAGNIPSEQSEVSAEDMAKYDVLFKEKLLETRRNYLFLNHDDISGNVRVDSKGRQNVLSSWAQIAHSAGADYIIVPQILDFEERDGDPSFVRSPARFISDIFLIVALDSETGSTDGALQSRSHYREVSYIQPNFRDSGNDYVSSRQKLPASAFAKEAILKAIRDFSL